MTREEALNKAINIVAYFEAHFAKSKEAREEAANIIEALEQEPKTWGLDDAREDFMHDVYNTLDFLPTNHEANLIIDSFDRVTIGINQEPCTDAISRQAVLDKAVYTETENGWCGMTVDVKDIESLASVTQKPKTGHWEWVQYDGNPEIGNFHCSECRYIPASFNMSAQKLNYCPKCGAKME